MAFNSNGQISYLVLDSLKDGAKYGLEIIEYISKKTNGGFIMKKPTLYSCLTRMEKKGLVSSSFWGESDLGGKRHYYSITNAGKETLAELEKSVEEMDFSSDESPKAEIAQEQLEQKPTFLQQDNLFDMVKEEKEEPKPQPKEESDVLENQIDIFNMEPITNNLENEQTSEQIEENHEEDRKEQTEEIKDNQEKIEYYQSILEQSNPRDDAVLLSDDEREVLTSEQEEQNRRLYDTSSELKKYRKKKSFAENQIEMSVVYQKDEDEEIQKERIAELKRSILNLRQNSPVEVKEEEKEVEEEPSENIVEEETETHDDAVFITEPRMDERDIPVQRKIAPPNIEVNIFDDNLPAPKRDSTLEPSYRDILSKVFERKKEKKVLATPPRTETIQEYQAPQNFGDYSSLKKHYQTRGIEFKEYKKSNVNRRYNTNLLQLINSIVLFVLSGISSAILFWIISATGNLKESTNFMYYTFPIIFVLYALYSLIKFKCFPSKKAAIKLNEATNWIVFLLAALIIVIVNTICGMQAELMAKYLTSLLVPVVNIFILFPVHFYCKKFLYSKYSR